MVPPVATAVKKRNKQKSQNHGAKDVATPLINCKNTAATNGIRLPNLWNIRTFYYRRYQCHGPLSTKISPMFHILFELQIAKNISS